MDMRTERGRGPASISFVITLFFVIFCALNAHEHYFAFIIVGIIISIKHNYKASIKCSAKLYNFHGPCNLICPNLCPQKEHETFGSLIFIFMGP